MQNKSNFNLLGQHFLIDENVVHKMAQFANPGDIILEVGPGKGILTKALLTKGSEVKAIEIDRQFAPELEKISGRFEIIFGNVLEITLPNFTKIISSMPYHIIEPFVELIARRYFEEAVLLVGDKFAKEAIAKDPKDENFGKLSLLVQSFFQIEYLEAVSREAFDPMPRVNSAIIRLVPSKPSSKALLVFRELFLQRDKLLKNALREALVRVFALTKNQAREKIKALNFPTERLENNFENLANTDISNLFISISEL